MTNSPVDHEKFFKKYGVHYDPVAHGTPPDFGGRVINVPGKADLPILMNNKIRHVAGDHATKFNTPADFVRAFDAVVENPKFEAFARSTADDFLKIDDIGMKDVFGPNFLSRIKGYDLNGQATVFGPDTNIIAIFRKVNGEIRLTTLYPDP